MNGPEFERHWRVAMIRASLTLTVALLGFAALLDLTR